MNYPRWLCYTLTHRFEWVGEARTLESHALEGDDVWHLCFLRQRTCSRCGLKELVQVDHPVIEEFRTATVALGVTELTLEDIAKAHAYISNTDTA